MGNRAHVSKQLVLTMFGEFERMAGDLREKVAQGIATALTSVDVGGTQWGDQETTTALTAALGQMRFSHRGHKFPEAYDIKRFRANVIAIQQVCPKAIPDQLRGLEWGRLGNDTTSAKALNLAADVRAEYMASQSTEANKASAKKPAKPAPAGELQALRDMVGALALRVEALETALANKAETSELKKLSGLHQQVQAQQEAIGNRSKEIEALERRLSAHEIRVAPAGAPLPKPVAMAPLRP